jgi:hypothetical protein
MSFDPLEEARIRPETLCDHAKEKPSPTTQIWFGAHRPQRFLGKGL